MYINSSNYVIAHDNCSGPAGPCKDNTYLLDSETLNIIIGIMFALHHSFCLQCTLIFSLIANLQERSFSVIALVHMSLYYWENSLNNAI